MLLIKLGLVIRVPRALAFINQKQSLNHALPQCSVPFEGGMKVNVECSCASSENSILLRVILRR